MLKNPCRAHRREPNIFSLLLRHSFPTHSSASPIQRQHTATDSHSVALVVASKPALVALGYSTFFIGPFCVERRHNDHVTGAHERRGIHTSTVEASQQWSERLWSHRPIEYSFSAQLRLCKLCAYVCVYNSKPRSFFFPPTGPFSHHHIFTDHTYFIHKYIFLLRFFVCLF